MYEIDWVVIIAFLPFAIAAPLIIWRVQATSDRPVPVIDRSRSYLATVRERGSRSGEAGEPAAVELEYEDEDGTTHQVVVSEVPDDAMLRRFSPGSRWPIIVHAPSSPARRQSTAR